MTAVSTIEKYLAAAHGRRFCVLTNRGTTAITASLRALAPAGGKVVFPAVMCSVPVFAAPFAGWTPLFADVSLSDGNYDLADLERVLAAERPQAVVTLHMFGRMENMAAVGALAARFGASVVEDVALAMGASRGGKPAGAFGRLSCLSFVRKMIPLEMGGAVLTDEEDLAARARAFVEGLPSPLAGHLLETPPAMRAFHAMTGYVAAGGWSRRELLLPFESEFQRLLLAATSEADWRDSIVLKELEALPAAVQARRVRAEVYETALSHPRIRPLATGDSCFFAYPVRLEGLLAEDVLSYMAEHGHQYKRLAYPDIAPVFGDDRARSGAETLEKELIGFPVDDDQPVSSFWEYAGDFVRLLRDYEKDLPNRRVMSWHGRMEMRMGNS